MIYEEYRVCAGTLYEANIADGSDREHVTDMVRDAAESVVSCPTTPNELGRRANRAEQQGMHDQSANGTKLIIRGKRGLHGIACKWVH